MSEFYRQHETVPVLHREDVAAADSSDPANINNAINTKDFAQALVDVFVANGTITSVKIQPLFWNETEGKFARGAESADVASDLPKSLNVNLVGHKDTYMFIKVTALAGSGTPKVSVYVTLY